MNIYFPEFESSADLTTPIFCLFSTSVLIDVFYVNSFSTWTSSFSNRTLNLMLLHQIKSWICDRALSQSGWSSRVCGSESIIQFWLNSISIFGSQTAITTISNNNILLRNNFVCHHVVIATKKSSIPVLKHFFLLFKLFFICDFLVMEASNRLL